MRPRRKDRHLPACVYLKHGAYYLVRRGKWTLLGRTEPEALAEYANRRKSQGTLPHLIDAALPTVLHGMSSGTKKTYTSGARALKDYFEGMDIERVTPATMRRMRRAFSSTPNMGNVCLKVLRLVMEWACDEEYILTNPCNDIGLLKEGKRDRLITDAELANLRGEAQGTDKLIIDLLYCTAQRIGDVLALKTTAVKEEGLEIIQQKTGKKLTIQWNPDLREAVDAAREGNVRGIYLVHNRGRKVAYRTFHDHWKALCARLEIKGANIHDLRHKALTDANKQGKDAQALAGHSDPKQTEDYIRERQPVVVEGPSIRQKAG